MEYIKEIATFIAGMATGWSLKVIISNKNTTSHRSSVVNQSNNRAGGDIVAGDKTSKR